MKEPIVYKGVSEGEKIFETLAGTLESGFSSALGNLTQAEAFSRCTTVEKSGLRAVLESLAAAACAVEIRYQTGLAGNLLIVCKVADMARLGELLAGIEGTGTETLSPELVESCMRFFALSAGESNKAFSAKHFQVSSSDPELLNPDGNTAGLEPLHSSYEAVLCTTYRVGVEPMPDCPLFLLADGQLLESLVKMLPINAPKTVVAPAAPQRAAPQTQMPEVPVAAAPGVETAPVNPAKAGPEKTSGSWNIDLLLDVELPVAVSFGECQMPLKDVLKLAAGAVIELDKSVNDPVTIIVNDKPIARGEVVMVDGNYGVRITEVESAADRIRSLS